MVLSGPISQAFEGPGEDRVSDRFFDISAGEKLPGKHCGHKPDVLIESANF